MTPPDTDILISRERIATRVSGLGEEILLDFKGTVPCVVPVMSGGMIFAADLVRSLPVPLTIHPVSASSYGSSRMSSGSVEIGGILPRDFAGKHVLLVDDILDTGLTLRILEKKIREAGAKDVKTCVLLRKASAAHLAADYVGFEIPDRYVIGYGLDLDGLHRNLPDIAALRNSA